jgi:basic membrane protein A
MKPEHTTKEMNMQRRILAGLTAAALIALTLVGCSAPSEGSGSDDGAVRIGVAYGTGGRGDKFFNDSVASGIDRATQEFGVEVQELAPNANGTDLEDVLRLLAQSGDDPVFAVGFTYAEPLARVAPDFPDTTFVIVDDESVDLPNVTGLVFHEEQASFLVGAAAALKSETGHIGFIGGVQTPPQEKFLAGYAAGAQAVDPSITIDSAFLTQAPDFSGFSSPDKAKEAALGMYDAGADYVYQAAGASGLGVFQAATDAGQHAIGVDVDQYLTVDPELRDVIATSATKALDVAVYDVISEAVDGEVTTGVRRFGLAEDGVGYATSGGAIDDIIPELEEFKQQIIDGTIVVPTVP